MFRINSIIALIAIVAAAAAPPDRQETDGRSLPRDRQYPKRQEVVRVRPFGDYARQHNTAVSAGNFHLHDLVDLKGFHFTATASEEAARQRGGALATFRSITLENFEIDHLSQATPGLHLDAAKLDASAEPSIKTDVTIRNGSIHHCGAGVMPLHIKDGRRFGTITLQNLSVSDCVHPIMIGGAATIDGVVIDSCPGIRVALQGKPGSIGSVIVRNSPAAAVYNSDDGSGQTPAVHIECDMPLARQAATTTAPLFQEDRQLLLNGRRYRVIDEAP